MWVKKNNIGDFHESKNILSVTMDINPIIICHHIYYLQKK